MDPKAIESPHEIDYMYGVKYHIVRPKGGNTDGS
jgi:hypothetical protein